MGKHALYFGNVPHRIAAMIIFAEIAAHNIPDGFYLC